MRNESVKIKIKKDNTVAVIIAAAILVAILMILLKIGFMSVYATKGDDVLKMTSDKATYVEMNKKLETEIAELQSVHRIESVAKDKLHMVKSQPVKYIDLH